MLLTLRDVSKRFASGTLALSGIDLDLARGEFVSLLGPSGCGKSTLLRLIAGLTAPSAGTMAWGSADHTIGFVFQDATLMPWANVLDNVSLPLRLAHVARGEADQRARDMLSLVGLADSAAAYPRQLSGGMRMRVSIARALVTRPALLLMDEPFAALDEITRNRLNDDLLTLWRQQRFTAVFVTHSVVESVYLSQRVLTMAARPGRIVSGQDVGTDDQMRPEGFRTSAAFAAVCRDVSASLTAAMAA